MNNPLLYVDYNGYTLFGSFFRWVGENWKPIVTIAAQVAVAVAVSAIVVASAGTMAPLAIAVLAGTAGGAAGGFVGGVLGTALNGGDFGHSMAAGGMGALIGGASGALGGFASAFAPPGAIMGALYGAGTGTIVGGIGSQMSGGSFWDGAAMGAVFGGIGGGIGGYLSAKAKGLNPWTGGGNPTNVRTTVIGETMKRVKTTASDIPGARTINNMPEFTGTQDQITSQMMRYNRQWILNEMRSGNTILDIGLDINRAEPSIFYQMEQNMIKNYQILHPGSLNIIKP